MPRSDTKFRKWHHPDAERRAQAGEKKLQAEYNDRCKKLASLITKTVKQRHVDGHLSAFDIWSLLLQLKEEVDRMPNGLIVRQPWSSHRSTEGERAQFMSNAFNIALRHGHVKIYHDSDQRMLWLYAERTAPKWLVYRNGQVLVDYIPTKEELTVPEDGFDTTPELVVTDHHRRLIQAWRQ